jgi:hypothetical protein
MPFPEDKEDNLLFGSNSKILLSVINTSLPSI